MKWKDSCLGSEIESSRSCTSMRMFRERNEAVRRAVKRIDRAGLDVVHPAVQSQMSLFEREPHRRMSPDIGELGDHVFADHRVDAVMFALVLTRLVDDFCGIRVLQPVAQKSSTRRVST